MTKTKLLFIVLFVASALYTVLASLSLKIDENGQLCGSNIPHFFIPWSAGCFYITPNNGDDSLQNQEQVDFERKMLDRFNKKNGVNSEVLWHRLEFNIRHQHDYRISFQDLHKMYLDYTKSEHIKLERQVAYLHFLWHAELAPLAQDTLNSFCSTYIITIKRMESVSQEFEWRLRQREIPLKLNHCKNLLLNK